MRNILLLLAVLLPFASMSPALGQTPGQTGTSDIDPLLEHALTRWTGDLDGILERGFIRVATANSPMYFRADGATEGGLAVEFQHIFETYLNNHYKKQRKRRSYAVVLMPMARDKIIPAVLNGVADIAIANLTITPERRKEVSFTIPTRKNVRELVVAGPSGAGVKSFDDLAATPIHVRRSSSYFEHLSALNTKRKAAGKPEIEVREIDDKLEDFDILELVNSEVIAATVVDDHKAEIYAEVLDGLRVIPELAVHEGGEIAWAVRPDNPDLLKAMNAFAKTVRKGSLTGNILIKRFFNKETLVENVGTDTAVKRFEETVDIIRNYAGLYEFDWLMITAQGYQESRLDQSKKSHVGAIGIMQVMPRTARDPVVGIPNIEIADANVHAGVKYLRHLFDHYFDDPEISDLDRVLFSFAAYNAGPGNIAKSRRKAAKMGLDPNVWFDNVEIATARSVSREPVIYVRNIYKYFVSYKFLQVAHRSKAGPANSQ
ncbi:transporter substrate-binding domain-containing protein [Nisaea acidiphila]|uniref:Transporter substrate-binding domain-containing protein n=1 Tax=Nisaea acidiphila TaxID=1862145 RepID=A0A9J7ARE4_9PROT|nr:transporter substrate-binding domain-containing protein [Nisaea acidiphila]UUX50179.1 transporter substrate-binding domain-containing protein [Nisaea acidiphila]